MQEEENVTQSAVEAPLGQRAKERWGIVHRVTPIPKADGVRMLIPGGSAPAHLASLDSTIAYYNVIQMEEVLTLRLPKGSRRRLTQLAKRKRQNLSQYVRQAIEAQLWIDALDETVVLAAPKAAALGVKTDDDVFRLFS